MLEIDEVTELAFTRGAFPVTRGEIVVELEALLPFKIRANSEELTVFVLFVIVVGFTVE